MAGRHLTSLCAFAAAIVGGLTLIASAASARPAAAALQFGSPKNPSAVVLDPKTGRVLYVWRRVPKNGTAVVLDPKTGAVLYVWRGLRGR
jgi:cell division protein FtsI/penicillin-binding protein 2